MSKLRTCTYYLGDWVKVCLKRTDHQVTSCFFFPIFYSHLDNHRSSEWSKSIDFLPKWNFHGWFAWCSSLMDDLRRTFECIKIIQEGSHRDVRMDCKITLLIYLQCILTLEKSIFILGFSCPQWFVGFKWPENLPERCTLTHVGTNFC